MVLNIHRNHKSRGRTSHKASEVEEEYAPTTFKDCTFMTTPSPDKKFETLVA